MTLPSFRAQPIRTEEILGTTLRYLDEGSATRAALFENLVPPGLGVPPHRHEAEDESFYVLQGAITFEVEGAGIQRLTQGGYAFGPRGLWHSFRNAGPEPANMLVTVTPGSNLLRMFAELSQLPMPPDPAKIGAITARFGVHMLPPPG